MKKLDRSRTIVHVPHFDIQIQAADAGGLSHEPTVV